MLLVATLCLGFYSCSEDDDKEVNVTNLQGTWQRTHLTYSFTDSNGMVTESEDRDETNSEAPSRYEFRANGTFAEGFWLGSEYSEDGYWEGYYKVENKQLMMSETEEFISDEYDYFNIIELTDARMVLEVTDTYDGETYYEKATYVKVK